MVGCAGAVWAVPRAFVLTSGEKIEGEVLHVSRDEVTLSGPATAVFDIPLTQFSQADQIALLQWGRVKDARWANVMVKLSSGQRTDRERTGSSQKTKTLLVSKMIIRNQSPQPLKQMRAVLKLETVTKDSPSFLMLQLNDGPFVFKYGTLAGGETLEKNFFGIPIKEKLEHTYTDSRTRRKVSKKEEAEREIKSFRVYLYVGTELIWKQRVK